MVRPPSGLFERKYRKKPQIVQSTFRAKDVLVKILTMGRFAVRFRKANAAATFGPMLGIFKKKL